MSPRKPKATPSETEIPITEADTAHDAAAGGKAAAQAEAGSAAEKAANNRAKAEGREYEPNYTRPGKRRAAEDRAASFNKLAWLVEGATGLVEELRHSDLGLSEEFWVHAYAMRREGLLAARAAIDSLLEKSEAMEQAEQEKKARKARRGNVAVDF